MHLRIVHETIVGKVGKTVVPKRRYRCNNRCIGCQKTDLTATGQETTTT